VAPPVHYTRSGDANIAYQVVCSGPPDLLFCIGSYSNLDVLWESPNWTRLFERLSGFTRLILFDKRGTGLSDRPDRPVTLLERSDDIGAVLDAVGSERAYLMGFSEGGAMTVFWAATHPDRVIGNILYGAPPRFAWAPDWPEGTRLEDFEAEYRDRAASNYETDYSTPDWRRWFGPPTHDDPAAVEHFRRLLRAMGSPRTQYQQRKWNREIDVRGILPTVRVPTLVLVREDDPVCSVDIARWTASRIPDARLVILPGQGHLMFDIVDEVVAAIEEFVTGAPREAPSDRFLTTLVAADIVGSTEVINRLGDAKWRALLDHHYRLVGRRLAVHAGIEVDRAGDGFLARFDAPARAVRFARDLDREDQAIGLRTRAAVHTGEVEASGNAVRGLAVHIAARLVGLAGPGEVLVSGTVRDLAGGAGFTFEDRGLHALKGVPDSRQVYAVV
jgi:pimeloyl-ACP methyl ester carboxylesterase